MFLSEKINRPEVLTIFLATLFWTASCVDPVNIPLEEGEEFLVVDGDFTTDARPHQLKLYYAIGQKVIDQRLVENAQIFLVEENGEREEYQEMQPGLYQLPGHQIRGETGRAYHLEMMLPDGKAYRSRPEIMPRPIRGDSIYFNYTLSQEKVNESIINREIIEVLAATPLPQDGQDFWLKWDVTSLYSFPEVLWSTWPPPPEICYIQQQPNVQQIILLNGENIIADRLDHFKVSQKLIPQEDFEFRGKHYFLVNQKSITQGAHDYWNSINLVANQSGSIFDAPPAGVPGNIYNVNDETEIVLGYFELSSVDSLRNFVTQGDFVDFFQFTKNICATNDNPFAGFPFMRLCCQCELIENSTFNRPPWF